MARVIRSGATAEARKIIKQRKRLVRRYGPTVEQVIAKHKQAGVEAIQIGGKGAFDLLLERPGEPIAQLINDHGKGVIPIIRDGDKHTVPALVIGKERAFNLFKKYKKDRANLGKAIVEQRVEAIAAFEHFGRRSIEPVTEYQAAKLANKLGPRFIKLANKHGEPFVIALKELEGREKRAMDWVDALGPEGAEVLAEHTGQALDALERVRKKGLPIRAQPAKHAPGLIRELGPTSMDAMIKVGARSIPHMRELKAPAAQLMSMHEELGLKTIKKGGRLGMWAGLIGGKTVMTAVVKGKKTRKAAIDTFGKPVDKMIEKNGPFCEKALLEQGKDFFNLMEQHPEHATYIALSVGAYGRPMLDAIREIGHDAAVNAVNLHWPAVDIFAKYKKRGYDAIMQFKDRKLQERAARIIFLYEKAGKLENVALDKLDKGEEGLKWMEKSWVPEADRISEYMRRLKEDKKRWQIRFT